MKNIILVSKVALLVFLSAGIAWSQENIPHKSGGGPLEPLSGVNIVSSVVDDYNLQVVFKSTARRYLKDMVIAIQDVNGSVMLKANLNGERFFAKLPEGEYTVKASVMGSHEQKKKVALGKMLRTLEFSWRPK